MGKTEQAPTLLDGRSLVLRQAVGLRGSAKLGPPKIDPLEHPAESVEELHLKLRHRKAAGHTSDPGDRLQRRLRAPITEGDRGPGSSYARPLRLAIEDRGQLGRRRTRSQCVVDGDNRLAERQFPGEIHHGPGRAGDRQPAELRQILRREACSSYDDVLSPLIPRGSPRPGQPGGVVRRCCAACSVDPRTETRESCGTEVAHDRARMGGLCTRADRAVRGDGAAEVVPVMMLEPALPDKPSQVGVTQSDRQQRLPTPRPPNNLQPLNSFHSPTLPHPNAHPPPPSPPLWITPTPPPKGAQPSLCARAASLCTHQPSRRRFDGWWVHRVVVGAQRHGDPPLGGWADGRTDVRADERAHPSLWPLWITPPSRPKVGGLLFVHARHLCAPTSHQGGVSMVGGCTESWLVHKDTVTHLWADGRTGGRTDGRTSGRVGWEVGGRGGARVGLGRPGAVDWLGWIRWGGPSGLGVERMWCGIGGWHWSWVRRRLTGLAK